MCGVGCSFSMLQVFLCYNVIQVHFVGFSNKDCWIFQQTFSRKSRTFAPNFKAR